MSNRKIDAKLLGNIKIKIWSNDKIDVDTNVKDPLVFLMMMSDATAVYVQQVKKMMMENKRSNLIVPDGRIITPGGRA